MVPAPQVCHMLSINHECSACMCMLRDHLWWSASSLKQTQRSIGALTRRIPGSGQKAHMALEGHVQPRRRQQGKQNVKPLQNNQLHQVQHRPHCIIQCCSPASHSDCLFTELWVSRRTTPSRPGLLDPFGFLKKGQILWSDQIANHNKMIQAHQINRWSVLPGCYFCS